MIHLYIYKYMHSFYVLFHCNLSQDIEYSFLCYSSVQSLSCVRLVVTPWSAACQASLSIRRSKPWVSSMVSRLSQLSKSSSLANSNHVSSSWESYNSPCAVQKCHTPRQGGWAPDAMSVLLVEGLPTIFTAESVLHGTCP